MSDLRVLVVDDSAFNRVTIAKMLEEIPGVSVAGFASDGEIGLRKFQQLQPDLVTLDLEMPKMGGFTLLRMIMQLRPTPVLVISSRCGDTDVFKALELGAMDFVAKPSRPISSDLYQIQIDIERKLRDLMALGPQQLRLPRPTVAERQTQKQVPSQRRSTRGPEIDVLVIGASTGGPPALHEYLTRFKSPLPVPVAIAQHMPPLFTRSFAERLNAHSVFEVSEACDGELLLPGHAYICPGGRNMLLRTKGGETRICIKAPPEAQLYTPSVDELFLSATSVFAGRVLGIVMTGMGNDGARGVREIAHQGGICLAESEKSCVVYGMPKEAVATGGVKRALSLPELAMETMRYLMPLNT